MNIYLSLKGDMIGRSSNSIVK